MWWKGGQKSQRVREKVTDEGWDLAAGGRVEIR